MSLLDLDVKEIEVEYISPSVVTGPERILLMLTIVRGARGKRKLLGEAFTRQVYHPIIHFKVFDDHGLDTLFPRFLQQLIHRGYRPIQYRECDFDGRYSGWKACDLTALDTTSLERGEDASLGVGESFEDF